MSNRTPINAVFFVLAILMFVSAVNAAKPIEVNESITIYEINGLETSHYNCSAGIEITNPVVIHGGGVGDADGKSNYGVAVDWGDGTIVNSDDNSSIVIFNRTPETEKGPFNFSFTATHNYTSDIDFSLSSVLYHGPPPGNDISASGNSITVDSCVDTTPNGTITVIKEIINDNGGQLHIDNVTLKVNDTVVENGTPNVFDLGIYQINETVSSEFEYKQTFSGDCDVSGLLNLTSETQELTCIITNDDVYAAVCGNGIVDSNETCDAGTNNGVVCDPAYNSSCTYCSNTCDNTTVNGGFCGDGVLQESNEACDGNLGLTKDDQYCDSCAISCFSYNVSIDSIVPDPVIEGQSIDASGVLSEIGNKSKILDGNVTVNGNPVSLLLNWWMETLSVPMNVSTFTVDTSYNNSCNDEFIDSYTLSVLNDDDGDGVPNNGTDNCPFIDNPDQNDSDSDGLGDACDNCSSDPNNDVDGDSICGNVDNCPAVSNPDQNNTDGDEFGDACDSDDDNDGVSDSDDNCPLISNSGQQDSDNDGIGDVCDSTDGRSVDVSIDGNAGYEYSFTCTSQNFTADSFGWDFGDSTILANQTGSINHTFTQNGNYNVTCNAHIDNESISGMVEVSVSEPHVEVNIAPSYPQDNEYVFYCNYTNFAPTSFDWDFDDGEKLYDRPVNDQFHEFDANGQYLVTCSASEDNSTNVTGMLWVNVTACANQSVMITSVHPDPVTEGNNVTVNGTADTDVVTVNGLDINVTAGLWSTTFTTPFNASSYDINVTVQNVCAQEFHNSTTVTVNYTDGDSDGIGDDLDNCPAVSNPGQEDADNDGTGDACDTEVVNTSQSTELNSGDGSASGDCSWIGWHAEGDECVKDSTPQPQLQSDGSNGNIGQSSIRQLLYPEEEDNEQDVEEDGSSEGEEGSDDNLLTGAVLGGAQGNLWWLAIIGGILVAVLGFYFWRRH